MPKNPFPYAAGAQGVFQGIPTVAEWTRLTTPLLSSRNNMNLLAIDAALRNYEANVGVGGVLATMRLLGAIVEACTAWITDKRGSQSRRMPIVVRLQTNAHMALHRLNSGSTRAQTKLKTMKQGLRHVGVIGSGTRGTTLDPHYWLETNVAGSNPRHLAGGALADRWAASQDQQLAEYVRKLDQKVKVAQVNYVQEAQRWRYQIAFEDGRMYQYPSSATGGQEMRLDSGNDIWIFVVDLKGRCYASMGDASISQHSSIPAGERVLFAGHIQVSDGRLTRVDNASGHYKPKIREMLDALKVLEENGVDLERVTVEFMAGVERNLVDPDMRDQVFQESNNAQEFLRTQGNPRGLRTRRQPLM